MHEVHMAQSLLNIAIQEAQHHVAKRIKSVRVTMGQFSCVNPESLSFCFEQVSRGTIAEGARLEIQPANPAATCSRCQTVLVSADHSFFCPNCGEPSAELPAEEELSIDSLEIEY